MQAEVVPTPRPRFWSRDLADAVHLGSLRFGLTVFGILLAVFVVWELALGRLNPGPVSSDVLGGSRIAVNHIICVAYLVAAFVHAVRAGERTLSNIQPLGRGNPGTLDTSRDVSIVRLAGVIGLGAAFATASISPGSPSYDPRTWSAEVAWHRVLGLVIGVLALRLSALLVLQSVRLSRFAARLREIDLLDDSSLTPFTNQGLMNALLILGFAASYALFLVDLAYLAITSLLVVFTGGVAIVGLLTPLLGVRRRIREAKQAELVWTRGRIRAARRELERSAAGAPYGRLDELVAWEARVQAAREWPLDASALRRFALYLLIPLGSWSGGALVERLIDILLE